jgi:hypothetical protein
MLANGTCAIISNSMDEIPKKFHACNSQDGTCYTSLILRFALLSYIVMRIKQFIRCQRHVKNMAI